MPVVLHIPLILAKVVDGDGQFLGRIPLQPGIDFRPCFSRDRSLGPRVDISPIGFGQEAIGTSGIACSFLPYCDPLRIRFTDQNLQEPRLLPHLRQYRLSDIHHSPPCKYY